MEEQYLGDWNAKMMADYCWMAQKGKSHLLSITKPAVRKRILNVKRIYNYVTFS